MPCLPSGGSSQCRRNPPTCSWFAGDDGVIPKLKDESIKKNLRFTDCLIHFGVHADPKLRHAVHESGLAGLPVELPSADQTNLNANKKKKKIFIPLTRQSADSQGKTPSDGTDDISGDLIQIYWKTREANLQRGGEMETWTWAPSAGSFNCDQGVVKNRPPLCSILHHPLWREPCSRK